MDTIPAKGILTCNLCKDEGKETKYPGGDGIGEELMKAHLRDEHGVYV